MSQPRTAESIEALRAVFTNDVIRAVAALARQQNVCGEQSGQTMFVTGMEAAREYIIEHVADALKAQTWQPMESDDSRLRWTIRNIRLCASTALSFGHQATPQTDEKMVERKEHWLRKILAYCAEVGEIGSIMREPAPPSDRTEQSK